MCSAACPYSWEILIRPPLTCHVSLVTCQVSRVPAVTSTHQLLVVAVPADGQVEVVLGLHAALEHSGLPLRHEHLPGGGHIMVTVMLSADLCILDVGEELWRHGLLVLGDGGGELPLLDGVQPPQLLHADPHLTNESSVL